MNTPNTLQAILHLRSLNRKLIAAARGGDLETIKKLVIAGAQIRTESDEPLCCAVVNGNSEAVRFFLDRGAEALTQKGRALSNAIKAGHSEIVKILLEKRLDTAMRYPSMLYMAVFHGHIEVVRVLLEHGYHPQANRNYPLSLAARKGDIRIATLLLAWGANAGEEEESQQAQDFVAPASYPIRDALYSNSLEMVQLLVRCGVSPQKMLDCNQGSDSIREWLRGAQISLEEQGVLHQQVIEPAPMALRKRI